MYALAETIDPDALHRLARATFAEMALAGVTLVGEFHYLHHAPGGAPYADPNELGRAVIAAAAEAGIRIVLLDACYLHGGSARFRDASADAWAERVSQLDGAGAAIHSVRAVDPDAASLVAGWAATRAAPLHAHVSEQQAENAFASDTYGATPTALLERAGALNERFTAIHATHPSADDITMLGGAGATVCLCPTTERDLADGIGPARVLAGAGARLALGSDSQAVIDLLEEARAVELDERLASTERGRHGTAQLLGAATAGGYTSLGLGGDGGRIAAGALADLTTIALDSVRLGRPLHVPQRRRHRRARRIGHGRDVPARDRLLHSTALSRRQARDRRRRARRDRDELQPRLELHDVDGVLPRAGGPRHAHGTRRRSSSRHRS